MGSRPSVPGHTTDPPQDFTPRTTRVFSSELDEADFNDLKWDLEACRKALRDHESLSVADLERIREYQTVLSQLEAEASEYLHKNGWTDC